LPPGDKGWQRERNHYPKGEKVSLAELARIKLTRADFRGDWNYAIQAR
jgi:hypothetical protein